MVWTDKSLADSLGEWKRDGEISDARFGFLAKILDALRIKRLGAPLECKLVECFLTRGKYPASMGLRAWFNQIKPGNRDSSEFDTRIYEIVQQWRTDKEFTVSAIIWKKEGSVTPNHDPLKEGITIENRGIRLHLALAPQVAHDAQLPAGMLQTPRCWLVGRSLPRKVGDDSVSSKISNCLGFT